MTKLEKPLFDTGLLATAKFPQLNKEGKSSCQHEIQLWGFEQFLEDGWSTLCGDTVLTDWLEKLIQIEQKGIHPSIKEPIDRSIRFGASMIYYPLYLQAVSDGSTIPKATRDQSGSMRFDLNQEETHSFGIFLAEFDPELAATLGGFLTNDHFLQSLGIDQDHAYLGAYFTYFALAYKGQKDGLRMKFKSDTNL